MSRQRATGPDTSDVQDPPRARNGLLTVEQAAERLGCTVHYVRQLIKERRITYQKLGTARRSPVRIKAEVLEAFIDAHTVEAAG